MAYTREYFQTSADFLRTRVDFTPEVGVVLGSCLGPFAQAVETPLSALHRGLPRREADLRLCSGPEGGLHVRPFPLLRGLFL